MLYCWDQTLHTATLHRSGEQLLWATTGSGVGVMNDRVQTEMCTYQHQQKQTHKYIPKLNNWPNITVTWEEKAGR